ncbi:phytoene synthase [Xanthobacter sp. SG618]|uniref:phytoene/squalene synthase family protein n=1 Tax=Xanthobacter sp. SG618 TaxID=2587121 RepID=UPI00145FBF56|nr:phytoene/squalene synthase family protein [Xanthobacter sp. SG618]NMN56598.1 phytoene synthase [Xanthobacter sp. SG618]
MESPALDDKALDEAYAYCAAQVQAQDRDRFLAALFAPQDKRMHLLALYAYNLDVARVREVVREALPGEVRLAWWREVIEGEGRGDVSGHPVAAALLDTVARFRLPRASLIAMADARVFDLYDDPMPTVGDLEGYAGETASALLQLSALILLPDVGRSGDLAGHGGVTIAMTGLMRAFPIHAARGQCYIPVDVLARHGVGREEAVSGSVTPGLLAALAELRETAARHLWEAREAAGQTYAATSIAAPFLPLALVSGDLKALARVSDPFRQPAGLSPFRRQFALWWAAQQAVRGRIWF